MPALTRGDGCLVAGVFTMVYVIAWAWHLRSWQLGSDKQTRTAIQILWIGWVRCELPLAANTRHSVAQLS